MSLTHSLEHCRLLPLNQVASLKLKEGGEDADPARLPLFQLMSWGLQKGLRTTHRRTIIELARLETLEPSDAMDYISANIPGGRSSLERRILKLPPLAAAELLLDILDMRLKADPRNSYPG